MIDITLRSFIDPILLKIAKKIKKTGLKPNHITLIGFAVGLCAIPSLYFDYYKLALLFILLNRLFDGLDGSLASITQKTDFGGYLDIVLDFIFYSSIIVGFSLSQPENSLYSVILIFSFICTGTTFLAFSIFAEKLKIEHSHFKNKSFFYQHGLIEGFETILFMILICLLPQYYPFLSILMSILCFFTAFFRIKTSFYLFENYH